MARSRTLSVNAIRASGPRMMTTRQQKQRRDHPTILHALSHPLAQGLAGHPAPMNLSKLLSRQGRTEIGIALRDDRHGEIAHSLGQTVVAEATTPAGDQARRATLTERLDQPEHLPAA